ncbi:hypothetical protein Lalb_Chr11g0070031 [Lupinus albus]|uniref:Uncharacterized protein n=1 Tax=Lupinus albus TaxID=3870 RepID=A0A6A4PSS5_LUPAL|nr:hypothetical protein Lalb_Chr11g0070031 [Lupinus albus]
MKVKAALADLFCYGFEEDMILIYLLIFEDKWGTKNDPIFVTFCCFEIFFVFFIDRVHNYIKNYIIIQYLIHIMLLTN